MLLTELLVGGSALYTGARVYKKNQKKNWSYFYAGTAILFNPVVPFALGRELWSLVDLAVLAPLFVSLVGLRRLFPCKED